MTRGKPWNDTNGEFTEWAKLTGGSSKRKGIPDTAMAPSTVEDYHARILRVLTMTDPPYLEAIYISRRNGNKGEIVKKQKQGDEIRYKISRNINQITVEELVGGLRKCCPLGVGKTKPSNYRHYQQGCVVLLRWLIYGKTDHGKPILGPSALEHFRELAPSQQPGTPDFKIIEPELIDDFLTWLKPLNYDLHAIIWIMRNLGLRLSGMRRATVDLKGRAGPTNPSITIVKNKDILYINGKRKMVSQPHIYIYEKKRPRDFDLWDDIHDFIQAHVKYVRLAYPSSKYLFTLSGRPIAAKDKTVRNQMRTWFRRWWLEEFEEDIEPEFLQRFRPHNLRHAFGVYLIKAGVQESIVQGYFGHSDNKITMMYIRHVMTSASTFTQDALDAYRAKNKRS